MRIALLAKASILLMVASSPLWAEETSSTRADMNGLLAREAATLVGLQSTSGSGVVAGLQAVSTINGLPAVGMRVRGNLPISKLAPSKLVPDLCLLHYRVSTGSPECQAFFDQGLGYYYSYVWMESARSFETAAQLDPECALAWWGLSRALDRMGKPAESNQALQKADALKEHASFSEQQLILARMQEKGLAPNSGDGEARKKAAISTIDNLLSIHDNDEEAWYYRAQLGGGQDLFGGTVSSVPFYKALIQVNPMHPGANHELLHYYEGSQRPALGWSYAENYIKSSPGIPHPYHMQAHLATRLGRWDKTSDRSMKAVELERAYHKEMNVNPQEDPQFYHHLEVLTISLTHDGRLDEARAIKAEAEQAGYKMYHAWFRVALTGHQWDEALKIAEDIRKAEKQTSHYYRALVYLRQGNAEDAEPEIEVLREMYQRNRGDLNLQLRLWETTGLWLCLTGAPDDGLKLLQRAADRVKNDYSHHSWGNGSYYMEEWGIEALRAGKLDVAEVAFLESLAHDPGSVHGALGMQLVCEKLDRKSEAERYGELAHRAWGRADAGLLDRELEQMRGTQRVTPREAGNGR
jgi:Tfp pilus assembly protein PilF